MYTYATIVLFKKWTLHFITVLSLQKNKDNSKKSLPINILY